jgi:hypothetical protein
VRRVVPRKRVKRLFADGAHTDTRSRRAPPGRTSGGQALRGALVIVKLAARAGDPAEFLYSGNCAAGYRVLLHNSQ